MIAEVFLEVYDAIGRKVSKPSWNRRAGPTFPMGRYISQPLAVKCGSIHEICKFLRTCRGVSDEDQFGRPDYWQPPEDFEQRRTGDCDDFALWTWRQLLSLGYDARVVFGRYGRFGQGHAWVEFFKDGKCYLVEPQKRYLGESMPRISSLSYSPELSVSLEGGKLTYYAHKKLQGYPAVIRFPAYILEWMTIWMWFWLRVFWRAPIVVRNVYRNFYKSRQRK